MKNIVILFSLSTLLLGGCVQEQKIDDVTKFSTDAKGDYLLFHFMDPYEEEGYIAEVDNEGKVIKNYVIKDTHFAPSIGDYYNNNYYFASAAYSNSTKIMEYNPQKRKFTLLDTNQNKFIDKYHKDSTSQYITNLIDKNGTNEVCDITLKKCVEYSGEYMAHSVTTLKDNVIVVGLHKSLINSNKVENSVQIKKFNRKLEPLKEITLDQIPNYFTYTSPDQKLYLFMKNGEIVEIDSDLNVRSFPINLSNFSGNIEKVKFGKNVMIDEKRILVDMEIVSDGKKADLLAEISFEHDQPVMNVIQQGADEDILNVDYDTVEVFTRSYVNKQTVISIRDLKTYHVKNRLVLRNNDPIYFVDNIQ